MGLISINEKALCSAIYGERDAAERKIKYAERSIEHLECELNLLRNKVMQLEKKVNDTISNHTR